VDQVSQCDTFRLGGAPLINLLEYEGKEILANAGIAVPLGGLYHTLPSGLDGDLVVKAQILSGGRGKAGGIRFANGREAALRVADTLAGATLNGFPVEDVYIEQRLDIAREFYVSALVDRDLGMPMLLACGEGGMDIEDVPNHHILRQPVDPLIGLQPFMVNRLLRGLTLEAALTEPFRDVIERLCTALLMEDAELIEVNPLVLTKDRRLVAADAKVLLDEDAAFRHPGRRAVSIGTGFERECRALGMIGVETGAAGAIAAIMNGAGLTMATLDEIIALGGVVSGVIELHGAMAHGPDRIADAIALALRSLKPAIILVNVHFQFRDLTTIASGIVRALQRLPGLASSDLVVRLRGEKETAARAILASHGCRTLAGFGEACALAVQGWRRH
jgi:succinyl-CoA synthetase beta subunit